MKNLFFIISLLLIAQVMKAQGLCQPNSNSLQFDGFSSYVDVSSNTNLALGSALTVEAWISPTAFGSTSAQNSIFCKHGWSQGEGGYVLRCGGNGVVSFNIAGLDLSGNPTSWIEVATQSNLISLNTWNHVAGTFDGDTLNLFVNGLLSAQTPFQGTITGAASYPPKIGRLSDSFGGRYFNGSIDEVRVWNRELNAAEINDRMSRHLNPAAETGLVGYWRFNEGSGSITNDYVQQGISANIIGGSFSSSVPFSQSIFTASISALDQDTICANEMATFVASPNGQGYSFLWSNGITDSLAVINTPGVYYAIITDGNGCADTSNTLQLVVNPLPATPVLSQSGNDILASNVQGLYQWYKDGVTFSDDLTVSNASPGNYVLLVEDTLTGCVASSNVLAITTGITENMVGLQIFPNPVSSELFIRQEISPENGIWQVFDLSGREVKSGILPGYTQLAIPLSELNSGLYLLRLEIQDRLLFHSLVKK